MFVSMTICIERVNLDTFEYLFQDIDQSKNGYKNLRKYVIILILLFNLWKWPKRIEIIIYKLLYITDKWWFKGNMDPMWWS